MAINPFFKPPQPAGQMAMPNFKPKNQGPAGLTMPGNQPVKPLVGPAANVFKNGAGAGNLPTPGVPTAADQMKANYEDMLKGNAAQKDQAMGLAAQQGAQFQRLADTANAATGRGIGGGWAGLGRQAAISNQALGARTGLQYDQMAQDIKGNMLKDLVAQDQWQKNFDRAGDWRTEDINRETQGARTDAYMSAVGRGDNAWKEATGQSRMPAHLAREFEQWWNAEFDRTGKEPLVRNFPGIQREADRYNQQRAEEKAAERTNARQRLLRGGSGSMSDTLGDVRKVTGG